ncbi:MAG: ATP-binding protein, partial [Candidatus Acidiferrum sp.]
IGHDVQSLSHQLHNSKLEFVGVVSAIRGLCEEVRKQYDVSIAFRDENVPERLPANVSLCLFRVAQEALHNAVKYSGAKQFEVEIKAGANDIELVVSDAGAGFDVEEAVTNRGLGLVSMQERVHLVRGRFGIESRPGSGTKIVAAVPLLGADELQLTQAVTR